LALSEPHLVRDLVSVDNAPVDAALQGTFAKYIQGMRKIEESGVTRQTEADQILQAYEPVGYRLMPGTSPHVFQADCG
jgi:hypothetical protein